MAHRRADWGSVTKVSPGVWRIRYWADGPDGYRRRSKTVRGTRRDVGDALAALRLDHSADAPCPTVGQCWDRWYAPALDAALAEGSKAPNTVRGYRNAYDVHIAPPVGRGSGRRRQAARRAAVGVVHAAPHRRCRPVGGQAHVLLRRQVRGVRP